MKKDIQKEITEKIIALIEEHGANWLQALKDDKTFIYKAAGQAQKAVDFLHGLQEQERVAA